MNEGKFKIGHCYYCCYESTRSGRYAIVVETWVYHGVEELPYSTTRNDVPNHFLTFKRHGCSDGVRCPSLKYAEMSYLTWEEFTQELNRLSEGDY